MNELERDIKKDKSSSRRGRFYLKTQGLDLTSELVLELMLVKKGGYTLYICIC